jgi:predicted nucleic acid-binding protein
MVVDASAYLEALKGSPRGRRLVASLERRGETFHSPALVDAEVAQALRRWTVVGGLPAAEAAERLEVFLRWPIRRYEHAELVRRAWQLRHAASIYDGLCLALAEALGSPLVTADGRLAAVRGHHARVEPL